MQPQSEDAQQLRLVWHYVSNVAHVRATSFLFLCLALNYSDFV